MLIYLDTNIVQYCADYEDFIFGLSTKCPSNEPRLVKELKALRKLVDLEQLGDWSFAAPYHLITELYAGTLSSDQREVYRVLQEAWEDSEWLKEFLRSEGEINDIEQSLVCLNLRDCADRRHLAEAIGLNASWFLTNDTDIVKKVRKRSAGKVGHTRVSYPSECLESISLGMFLR